MLNISSFLLLATIASYLPQIRRIALRKDCSNISAVYPWLNHVLATEQFAIGIVILVEYEPVTDSPPPLKVWLDFLQFAVVWAGNGILLVDINLHARYRLTVHSFVQVLGFPPSRAKLKPTLFLSYVAFFFISVCPAIFVATIPPHERDIPASVLMVGHQWFMHPVITVISIFAVVPQLHELYLKRSKGALSSHGIGLQALVFLVVAFCWPYRMAFDGDGHWPNGVRFQAWWEATGWAFTDNVILAVGYGVVWIAIQMFQDREETSEMAPLLG